VSALQDLDDFDGDWALKTTKTERYETKLVIIQIWQAVVTKSGTSWKNIKSISF